MMNKGPGWSLEDIAYQDIDRSRLAGHADWFGLLAASSFVEILSDLYARNLAEYYAGDDDLCAWLTQKWEKEEMQHGRALRRYVETVWPDFDWERGFAGFRAQYGPYCQTALLGPTRTLEMAARCVVETGTASFYTMIHDLSPEPVLTTLAGHIRNDEVGHYKGFYHYYRRYQDRESHSRWRVGRELWRRVAEIDSEDAYLAVRNAYQVRYPQQPFEPADFRAFRSRISGWMREAYPFPMAVKMLLKPLSLPPAVHRLVAPMLIGAARGVVALSR
ncbi:MAG: ferritin-like domain-containing protein [Gammaproteobacteria bacterium]|nr:ferritin-like domain-containing protein [Gammaproteobacteria bacterium]